MSLKFVLTMSFIWAMGYALVGCQNPKDVTAANAKQADEIIRQAEDDNKKMQQNINDIERENANANLRLAIALSKFVDVKKNENLISNSLLKTQEAYEKLSQDSGSGKTIETEQKQLYFAGQIYLRQANDDFASGNSSSGKLNLDMSWLALKLLTSETEMTPLVEPQDWDRIYNEASRTLDDNVLSNWVNPDLFLSNAIKDLQPELGKYLLNFAQSSRKELKSIDSLELNYILELAVMDGVLAYISTGKVPDHVEFSTADEIANRYQTFRNLKIEPTFEMQGVAKEIILFSKKVPFDLATAAKALIKGKDKTKSNTKKKRVKLSSAEWEDMILHQTVESN